MPKSFHLTNFYIYLCVMNSEFLHIIAFVSEFKESMHLPNVLKHGGFLLCTAGESSAIMDGKLYKIKRWDMLVAFPHSTVQLHQNTPDFEGIIMGVGVDFFSNIELSNKITTFTSIRENPSISLTPSEGEKILSLRDMLQREQNNEQHPFRYEIVESVLKIILYEVAAIYNLRKPNSEQHRTREEVLFHSFITLMYNEYHSHRSLEYYAQHHSITPSHLARVVKRVSGRKATDWINEYTTLSIKHRLQNQRIPINLIADEFDFPNASFFSQYFKRHTGLTPSQYRAGVL